jgi:type II secretory pathway pseudopilin PulG
MRRIDNAMSRKRKRGITLIEVVIATMILFVAMFFLFEVITTAYSQITKLKYLAQIAVLTQSKVENIIYENAVTPTAGWKPYEDYPEYEYKINVQTIIAEHFFPQFLVKRVTVSVRGPKNRSNIPERQLFISTCLIDETQTVVSCEEKKWGEGLSPEVHIK